MVSDPRVHKPRLPKAYTDQQLAFLKSNLPEFERRSQGSIRGDAKKFALERAADFIGRFGLPDEFIGVEESESRFREASIPPTSLPPPFSDGTSKYTTGSKTPSAAPDASSRAALAAAAAAAAVAQAAVSPTNPNELQQWTADVSSPTIVPYPHAESSTSPVNAPQPIIQPIQYTNLQPTPTAPPPPLQPTSPAAIQPPATIQPPPPIPQPTSSPHHHPHPHAAAAAAALTLPMTQVVSQSDLRDAFLQGIDASTLSSMIQTFVLSNPNPSPTPLTPVVEALFEAVSADSSSLSFNRDHLHVYLRRYFDAASYFTEQVVHAGISGPMSGTRALQMLIRKYSTWIPHAPPLVHSTSASSSRSSGGAGPRPNSTPRAVPGVTTSTPGLTSSLTDDMQRIAADRQRKKDHIQWARIHAAALELGVLGLGRIGDTDNSGYTYAMGRAFSEMMARDAVWESDEVEWVAGICVLRSVIRTAMRGDRRQRDEYDELLRTYEGRWKEIKDEARQALVTDVLLGAREDLSRMLDENLS
ncbi:hypothetical protein AGABI1DRAFT_130469 [Agaricus bisporus var. burnettii JB137-S8]|uniref:Uncharacterized protein n=1 Tax=Agaricus bisporus var. burnettii (strain JB137-S8 / ATCC MYA-4627 / FGSC 10392) TaxID=597362 RepID=K5X380_AGABU|nr:uncharacterized protein AGABI1DRAFT_130469 [Agaricus bisporus var. burnettii JB137-S8]EKM77387.1 hypothetical protein AGABI1DRAFT_130469 [Agaricus bisporus var. burnettii JB137-S8]